MDKAFKIISIFSDNAIISVDDGMDFDEALERYKELNNMDNPGDGLKCFVFLVRGEILKINNNLKENKNV
jgi:hypothetical protein